MNQQRSGEADVPPGTAEKLFTVKEAAQLFFQGKVSARQVNALFHQGELRGFRVGAKILLYGTGLDEYRQRHENRPTGPIAGAAPVPPPATLKPARRRAASRPADVYEFFPPRRSA